VMGQTAQLIFCTSRVTVSKVIAFINNQLLLPQVNTRESSPKVIRKEPMSGCSLSVQESSGTMHEGAGTYTCHVGSVFVALTNPSPHRPGFFLG
jgi:hypothetical protein